MRGKGRLGWVECAGRAGGSHCAGSKLLRLLLVVVVVCRALQDRSRVGQIRRVGGAGQLDLDDAPHHLTLELDHTLLQVVEDDLPINEGLGQVLVPPEGLLEGGLGHAACCQECAQTGICVKQAACLLRMRVVRAEVQHVVEVFADVVDL